MGVRVGQRLPPGPRGGAEPPADQGPVRDGIAQLIGGDADVVGLLSEGERRAMAGPQGPPARREHDALGALRLCFLGPADSLDELHFGGASDEEPERQEDAELDHLESNCETRHRYYYPPPPSGEHHISL